MARQNNHRYPNADVIEWKLVNNSGKTLNKEGKVTTIPKHRIVSREVGKVLDVARRLRVKGVYAAVVRS